jgi:nitrogen fixation-related uncharacterized protein
MTFGEILVSIVILTIVLAVFIFILKDKNYKDYSEEEEKEWQKIYDEVSNKRYY